MMQASTSQSHHSGIERATPCEGAKFLALSQSHHSGIERAHPLSQIEASLQVPIAPQWD